MWRYRVNLSFVKDILEHCIIKYFSGSLQRIADFYIVPVSSFLLSMLSRISTSLPPKLNKIQILGTVFQLVCQLHIYFFLQQETWKKPLCMEKNLQKLKRLNNINRQPYSYLILSTVVYLVVFQKREHGDFLWDKDSVICSNNDRKVKVLINIA